MTTDITQESSTTEESEASAGTAATAKAAPANHGVAPDGVQTKAPKGIRSRLQQMLAGIQSAIPDGSTLPTFNNQQMTKAAILAMLEADLAMFNDADAQLVALIQARATLRAKAAAIRADFTMLRSSVELVFGKGSPELAQFGLSQKVPAPLTAAQKLVRTIKAKETRRLRGTLGPRQKAKLQFQGGVQVVTSVSGPAAKPEVEGTATGPASSAPVASARPAK